MAKKTRKIKKLNKKEFEVTESQETKTIYNIETLKENKKKVEERLAKINSLIEELKSAK